MLPSVSSDNDLSVANASGFTGGPDRPPASERREGEEGEADAGRERVVLETMIPSIFVSSAALATSSSSDGERSGAILIKIGGRKPLSRGSASLAEITEERSSEIMPFRCKERRPGVLGEETLITSTSARGPNRSTPVTKSATESGSDVLFFPRLIPKTRPGFRLRGRPS